MLNSCGFLASTTQLRQGLYLSPNLSSPPLGGIGPSSPLEHHARDTLTLALVAPDTRKPCGVYL
jgi:hypothetical protein